MIHLYKICVCDCVSLLIYTNVIDKNLGIIIQHLWDLQPFQQMTSNLLRLVGMKTNGLPWFTMVNLGLPCEQTRESPSFTRIIIYGSSSLQVGDLQFPCCIAAGIVFWASKRQVNLGRSISQHLLRSQNGRAGELRELPRKPTLHVPIRAYRSKGQRRWPLPWHKVPCPEQFSHSQNPLMPNSFLTFCSASKQRCWLCFAHNAALVFMRSDRECPDEDLMASCLWRQQSLLGCRAQSC